MVKQLVAPRANRKDHPCVAERRASFGELVMQDSSPFRWLEERGRPAIDCGGSMTPPAVSMPVTEHDTTEENLRTFGNGCGATDVLGALHDKNQHLPDECSGAAGGTLREKKPLAFGRALGELGIDGCGAQSQAKGRIERLFETLAGSLGEGNAFGRDRQHRCRESLFEMPLSSGVGRAFSRWRRAGRAMRTDGWIADSAWRKF